MDPVSLSVSITALLQLTGIVVKYLHDVKGAPDDMRNLLVEISSIRGLLFGLEDLATLDETWVNTIKVLDGPDGPLSQFRLTLEFLATKLEPVVGFAKIGRALTWPFRKGEIKDMLSMLERQKALFALALRMDHIGLSREISDHVSELHEGVKDLQISQIEAAYEKVLRWLSSTDPSTNHTAACAKHEPMTGDWLLESTDFESWLEHTNSVFWLYGIPGCGKTVLCSSVIERVKSLCTNDSTDGYAYYYFDFNDERKQRLEGLLRSILAQLSGQKVKLPEEIQRLHDENTTHQQQPNLSSLIETFFLLIRQFRRVYLVIDALDECIEREDLLNFINEVVNQKANNASILVASRREQDFVRELEGITNYSVCVQDARTEDDIRLFIQKRLMRDSKLKKRPESVKREIERSLVDGAHGMFRWVACQLEALGNCLSPLATLKALQTLPRTLDDTYNRILLNIPEDYRTQAVTALQWLAFSERPLCLEEVAEAVAVKPGYSMFEEIDRLFDPYEILTVCSSLVVLSETTREMRLAHYSVKEYLVSERIKKGSGAAFHLVEASAHRSMAEICCTYLLSFDRPDSLILHPSKNFPLLRYATENWYKHARIAQTDSQKALDTMSLRLLDATGHSSFHNWLRIFQPDRPSCGPMMQIDLTEIGPPLYYASYLGLLETVRILLENGVDANSIRGYYGNPLQAAAFRGYEKIVQFLIEHGADVNNPGGRYGNALQAAFVGRHEHIISLLIEHGADVNTQGGYYGNALQAALTRNLPQHVPTLLAMGADVNAQGGQFGNALQAASRYSHESAVELLLENGADVNASGGYYGTALQAASRGGSEKIVRRLLEKGADVNARGGSFGNALKVAKWSKNWNILHILLEWGADKSALDQ